MQLIFLEATSTPNAKYWDKDITTEIDSIKKTNTLTLVDFPKGAKHIGCKWIFRISIILMNRKIQGTICKKPT